MMQMEESNEAASSSKQAQTTQHTRSLSGHKIQAELAADKEEPTVASPGELVHKFGGKRSIEKILIANNGIGAVKFMRSVRRWSYEVFGNERAIKFHVMVTPEDMKANAEFIHLADNYLPVPGGTNNYNYANVDLILDLAKRIRAEAVWAGWGHASENPKLPELLHKNGIAFLGPPAQAMWSLGDKIASSIVAQTANVPTLPWSGSGLKIEGGGGSKKGSGLVHVPNDIYLKGCVNSIQDGLKAAESIGYPVMIKASAGGGGKGIRKARNSDEFPSLFHQVQAEVPGSPVFVMQLAKNARHLEVQILADEYGNAISLFGRDCSVQRRHQKIIEEAPATIADPEVFVEMEKAAVRLAKMVGYVSAGTVEYLYLDDEKRFYFLELNPRLQVEHPCTEMVADVNLPALQLQVAMGLPLHRIKDIRVFFKVNPYGDSLINFDNPLTSPTPHGHVIACRITAENPDDGFQPSSGTVQELNFRSSKNVWGYFSVAASGGLHEFADSQFGHCFAWGETRDQARRNMVLALKELSIRGDFRTTIEYLVTLLETHTFHTNSIDTAWLDQLIASNIKARRPEVMLGVVCGSLCIAEEAFRKRFADYQALLERGQVMNAEMISNVVDIELISDSIKYSLKVSRIRPTVYMLLMNDSYLSVDVHRMTDGTLLVSINGSSYTTYFKEEVDHYRVVVSGQTGVFEKENDPQVLRATSPGKLIRFLQEDGDHVDAGNPYAEIEVMKMITNLYTTQSGIIHHKKQPGAILHPGTLVAKLDLDDASSVTRAVPFSGSLPQGKKETVGLKSNQLFRTAVQSLQAVMAGYSIPDEDMLFKLITENVELFLKTLKDPTLPMLETKELLSTISGRIPVAVETAINKCLAQYAKNVTSILSQFPSQQLNNIINRYAASIQRQSDQDQFFMNTNGIVQLLQRYVNGSRGRMRTEIIQFLKEYYRVEEAFQAPYDLRYNQVESIFLSSIDGDTFDGEKLEQLIKSDTSMFDVLPSFFYHQNKLVRVAALEVYVRRAYTAYDVLSVLQEELLNDDNSVLQWQFLLPSNHPNRTVAYRRASTTSMTGLGAKVWSLSEDLSGLAKIQHPSCQRTGIMAAFTSLTDFDSKFESLMELFASDSDLLSPLSPVSTSTGDLTSIQEEEEEEEQPLLMTALPPNSPRNGSVTESVTSINEEPIHIINVSLKDPKLQYETDEILSEMLGEFVQSKMSLMVDRGIRRITFVIFQPNSFPKYFTFRARNKFEEDTIYRHLEPALAFQLEINRLSNFMIRQIPTKNHRMHLYLGSSKVAAGQLVTDHRFFIRTIIRHSDFVTADASFTYMEREGERMFLECLDQLQVATANMDETVRTDCNHIFLHFVPPIILDPQKIADKMLSLISKYGVRLVKLRVMEAEIKATIRLTPNEKAVPVRVFISSDNSLTVRVHMYQEIEDAKTGEMVFHSWKHLGPLHGIKVSTPYPSKDQLQQKRYVAQNLETTYIYDFIEFFKQAVLQQWEDYQTNSSEPKLTTPSEDKVVTAIEFDLDQNDQLQVVSRHPGDNTIGMVAWRLTLLTPCYPDGRDVIVIGNDITHQIGSFGPKEDLLYQKASELSREEGIPRIYISANSGARIGLAEEIKQLFQVAWIDKSFPEKGFKYIYLSPSDYMKTTATSGKSASVITTLIQDEGEPRYKIIDIIGKKDGLGVENLRGSGTIAGETSRAYDDVFTINLVTCRAIGIGAYLVRLGQRVIQVDNSHIILTGAGALNKVLGREVYTSNAQLGGVQIMHNNGVSHLTAPNDYEGVASIVNWIEYIPKVRGFGLPILPSIDPVDRVIEFEPTKLPYDPRHMLAGRTIEGGDFETGFFDKGSFQETLSVWAQSVVCGRARIGGIPCGVIAVETRAVEFIVPADPANPQTESHSISQAGQVWYPDSAFKTAQTIQDLNREELPLFIFANWRGFSGGMRDMYEEVVKYGAMIVDGLRAYKHPVFIYLPPHGELRGGAWVVVDPTINPDHMEMYADKESKGGVLEAEGTVEIKFKTKDLVKTMARLDKRYIALQETLKKPGLSPEERQKLETELKERETLLAPIYHQIAVEFAELHDTPGRMKEKGVISDVLEWKNVRKYFYWKLRRRLCENDAINRIKKTDSSLCHGEIIAMIRRWFVESKNVVNNYLWYKDEIVVDWLESSLKEPESVLLSNIESIKKQKISHQITQSLIENQDIAVDCIVQAGQSMSSAKRREIIKHLTSFLNDS
uniref:Uncharacterized protein n=1 Tax=Amphimedon queenslandica TaxID=400682 RepID=A0A1X7VP53_AMPQE